MLAQLRDVLAAEDSTIVAKEDYHRGMLGPEGTELDWFAIHIRQRHCREFGAE
jgi:hypothetical protein